MTNTFLLISFAGLSIASGLFVLLALLKVWKTGKVPESSRSYFGLNVGLLVIVFLCHFIDILFAPLLMNSGQTEDSFFCSLHGACLIYVTLWFYSILMFLAVETFLYLYTSIHI